jgi:hypothetical protein
VSVSVGVAVADATCVGVTLELFSVAVLARFVGADLNDPHAERRSMPIDAIRIVFCTALQFIMLSIKSFFGCNFHPYCIPFAELG